MDLNQTRKREVAILVGLALLAGCGATPRSSTKASATANEPIATINGQPIFEDELMISLRPQIQKLRAQEYGLKTQALEMLIDLKLIEAEAKRKGISGDKLLENEVRPKVSEPTESQIQTVYDDQKDSLKKPLEELRPQIRQAIKQALFEEAQKVYVQSLRARAKVDILLLPPRIEVAHDPARLRGDANAPVTIVEFSDFECPFCKAAQPTLTRLLSKYEGKVRISYRDFPLRPIHPHAQSAAEAARCAGEQGRFWEYHDSMFASHAKLESTDLKDRARLLHLNETQFDACLSSGKFQSQIQGDVDLGTKLGVTGTPSFFVNGILVDGAQPAAAFEKIIDSELKAAAR